MTVRPEARLDERFSDAITYSFRLRPATLPASGTHIEVGEAADEVAFDLTFEAPDGDAPQAGRCVSSLGGSVPVIVNDEDGGRGDGLRVFAGVRSDPFFIDLPAFERTLKRGRMAFSQKGMNSLTGANVLAIVVEVDVAALTARGLGPIWAVAAETRVTSTLPIRIERVGRPEVKNTILQWKQFDPVYRDLELRDIYNLEDPYHLGAQYRPAYRSRLNANLAMLDLLDGKSDWPVTQDGSHPLTDIFLDDRLIVDVSKPFAATSFFEIERALLEGRAHTTCGGRWLNDPVMDTLYTVLIAGLAGTRVSDGVGAATRPAATTFPYLAPPTGGPWPTLRRAMAAHVIG
jgi:hypothetical protein